MKIPSVKRALQEVQERLEELLGLPASPFRSPNLRSRADAVFELGSHLVVVEWKRSGTAANVSIAAERARSHSEALGERAIPLVAVPFMGQVGRDRCKKAGVEWLDLSGNAHISAPGVRVWIEGRPNQFKRLGRPSSAFAPKSSRITRWLLMNPGQSFTQREIAQATEVDEGFTSRIVATLEKDRLIDRHRDGAVSVAQPDVLLDAWREDYHFSRHHIVRGHFPARSGDALVRLLVKRLTAARVRYAATGLAAAWLMTRFAAFRIATIYVDQSAADSLAKSLELREENRGANVWLVAPNDRGVFQGSAERDGIWCVHPVQAYLDLAEHPERAAEAAEQLRQEFLRWSVNA